MFFSAFGQKDMNCMFTGEKVTASAFSVNIGFISVKDVAELATLFDDDMRPKQGGRKSVGG